VAGQLPEQLGLGLLDVARQAFVQGMHLVAIISAAVAIGAAILALILLRHVPARSEQQPEMEPDWAGAGSAGIDRALGRSATPEKP